VNELQTGIPTVKRENKSYLIGTLNSLISNMDTKEQEEVLILVLIAEIDKKVVHQVAKEIRENFIEHLLSGMIEIIAPAASFYHPKMVSIKITLNDTIERVRWRSKENLDAAFLMFHVQTKSKYFMMIEDDVTTKSGFYEEIKHFIETSDKITKENPWFMLKISSIGTIATLFWSADLPDLFAYLIFFLHR
jgi:alpha-1,3-mannosylglycoprotein beta-1,4-N-acetylglucosaminyltransferase A/B